MEGAKLPFPGLSHAVFDRTPDSATPLLYLSAFFEASRRDYYDGLRGVSERGAWNDWLEHFLLGVARMSEDALNRATRIKSLLAQWQKSVAEESVRGSKRQSIACCRTSGGKSLHHNERVAGKLGIAFTTAQRAIERLERSSIVKQVGDSKRDRLYCAATLLDILEEPARLTLTVEK